MHRALSSALLFVGIAAGTAWAQSCPAGGLSAHGRCWYLSAAGQTCKATCAAQGLTFSWFVAPEVTPMVPQLLGRTPATKQFSWARLECYVDAGDRFHTAKNVADSNTGDNGDAGDWTGQGVCRLACSCSQQVEVSTEAYPGCIQNNIVLRHAGAHAIFVDLSMYGSAGCWQNDCKNTDKFDATDMGMCARVCAKIPECTHWTFGEQGDAKKCFFRKSDGGREMAEGFVSAPKGCAPPELLDAMVAWKTAEVLQVCDAGKSAACPDMARAMTTWKFAIKHLMQATDGKIDVNTQQYIGQISTDTDAFTAQMSEENFPVIVGNNRQVFMALGSWLASQTSGVEINPSDASLPNPLRGELCGPSTCFEKV